MDIASLTQQISSLAEKGSAGLQEADRAALLAATTKLQSAIENPLEKIIRLAFVPYDTAALRLGVDMGLYDAAVSKNGPITITELAAPRNANPLLVRRVMRLLTNLSLFTETDIDTYTATPVCAGLAAPSPLPAAIIHLTYNGTAMLDLPNYLAETGYQNPSDAFNGPFQFSYRHELEEGGTFWTWTAARPKVQEAFNTTMGLQKMVHGVEWFDIFPVADKLTAENDRVVLVDVGGGWGHDLKIFADRFPDLQGRLILEDLPNVIETAKDLPARIQAVGHDFFSPQPDAVKNAKSYYLRTVLHDWPDKQAKPILENIREAMAEDSLLLINEQVLPTRGIGHFAAQQDFHMMTQLGAMERTEEQWRSLLDSAGFEVRKVWMGQGLKQSGLKLSLIEAVVKK